MLQIERFSHQGSNQSLSANNSELVSSKISSSSDKTQGQFTEQNTISTTPQKIVRDSETPPTKLRTSQSVSHALSGRGGGAKPASNRGSN